MKVLIVIDMQHDYVQRSDVKKCIAPIQNLIRRFNDLEWPILLVEMRGYGRTIPRIRKQVYPWTGKSSTDGSACIIKRCKREKWPLDFVLCGVFFEICVRDTARGLVGTRGLVGKADVTIVTNATIPANPHHSNSNYAWPNSVQLSTSREFYRGLTLSKS